MQKVRIPDVALGSTSEHTGAQESDEDAKAASAITYELDFEEEFQFIKASVRLNRYQDFME